MSLVTLSNISKSYGERTLFENGNILIENNSRITLVGENGTGKSTILKMITGEIASDTGFITIESDKNIGYLPQDATFDEDFDLLHSVICINEKIRTILKELLNLKSSLKERPNNNSLALDYADTNTLFENCNGYELLEKAKIILKILGFSESDFSLNTEFLSGGQKTRALLTKLLLSDFNVLLLDEPTNHLDIDACERFVDFLNNQYKGATLMVSHDRYFIDQVTTNIIEIENGQIFNYPGNYSDYSKIKNERIVSHEKELMSQKKEIQRMEEAIQTLFSHRKFSARDSVVKKLSKIKKLNEVNDTKKMAIKLSTDIQSGREVLKFENMTKIFDDKTLFNNVSLSIERGEKIGIVGPNGSGKSTFIKIINGTQTANNGILTYGHNIKLAYFAQEFNHLCSEKTIMEELLDNTTISSAEARNLLAKFLFSGDNAFKLVKSLSGGEKCRLSLAKIMAEKPNLLLLDEPTNHLDIPSCEILETALKDYDGTIIAVSHDRYFLKKTTNITIEIKNGKFRRFFGDYDYYKEKSAEIENKLEQIVEITQKESVKIQSKPTSNRDLRNQLKPLKSEIKQIEQDIENYEQKLKNITNLLSSEKVYKDGSSINLTKEYSETEEYLNKLLENWENIKISIDNIESNIV